MRNTAVFNSPVLLLLFLQIRSKHIQINRALTFCKSHQIYLPIGLYLLCDYSIAHISVFCNMQFVKT